MTERESRYLAFETEPPKGKKKTTITYVLSKSSGILLGEIRWYGAWRQYCFFVSGGSFIFNWGCLDDINHFISKLMDERKVKSG
jgi:hypothetical protein